MLLSGVRYSSEFTFRVAGQAKGADPARMTSLEPIAPYQIVVSLSRFYRYYF